MGCGESLSQWLSRVYWCPLLGWEAMVANTDNEGEGTVLVAASDATPGSKKRANYICDGTADDVEIQAAIDGLSGGGGAVLRDRFQGQEWFSRAQACWVSQFSSVEGRLLSAFEYVELHPENRSTFSREFAGILRDAGSIFGSVADELVRGAGLAPRRRDGNYDFVDYRDFLWKQVPDLHRRTVALRPVFPMSVVTPFEELQTEAGIPAWWNAYNKVKHQVSKEFRLGNLENSVTAVCALALLGALMGTFVSDSLFVNVGIAYKEDSIDLSDERRLFSRVRDLREG
jgi:hypothetical protein